MISTHYRINTSKDIKDLGVALLVNDNFTC